MTEGSPWGRPPERQVDEALRPVLARACAAAGLGPDGAVLLRCVNNAVYRIPEHGVVVRIALAPALAHRVGKVVAVARWLAEHELPAVRLLDDAEQPVQVGTYLATLWHEVPPDGPAPGGADLARLVRQMHELPEPPFELPRWDPLADVRRRLADAVDLDPDDEMFLRQRCDEVEAELATLRYELPVGPIHGDAHLGNLIPGPNGPVLCDFDSTCVGPREWDLVPMAVGQLRFDRPPQHYRDFADRYGHDVTTWPGFALLREPRELKLVTSVLPILHTNPAVRAQWRRRMQTYREGNDTARWVAYP